MPKAKRAISSPPSGACAGTVLAIEAAPVSSAISSENVVMFTVEDILAVCVFGAIEEVCREKNVTTKENKDSLEPGEFTTFALDYLYKHMLADQLVTAAREHASIKLKNKKKPTAKDMTDANFLNRKITLNFDDAQLEQLVAWCRSEKQLKFWKMLWYSWIVKVNINLKMRGLTGSLSLPRNFYKNVETLYATTHTEAYLAQAAKEEEEDNALKNGGVEVPPFG
jgi:hypothetical protein